MIEQPAASAARQFPHHLVDREIPRRERRDRADRLLDHQLIHALGAGRDDSAVGAASFLGEPVDHVGARQHFALGFGQRLALLHGQQTSDTVRTLAQDVSGLAHNLGAVKSGHFSPGPEPFVGGFQGAVEVGGRRVRNRADLVTGGRIDDVDRAAAGGGPPGPVR